MASIHKLGENKRSLKTRTKNCRICGLKFKTHSEYVMHQRTSEHKAKSVEKKVTSKVFQNHFHCFQAEKERLKQAKQENQDRFCAPVADEEDGKLNFIVGLFKNFNLF